ncbi:MAG: ferredoxin [Alphaproteobacteria bacterium]|nr:MAG: ferredoxin [Alphaproteobacteria bacterium]
MMNKRFQISIQGSDKIVTCREDESLLSSLARYGQKEVPAGCRQGGCGVCKIRVLKGEFETGKMSIKHVSATEKDMNFTLACKTFPKSDMVITVNIKGDRKWQ